MSMGVSIIICCHNSEKELPHTIAHLAAQEFSKTILWEVIVIDNNSSDKTAEVAQTLWPEEHDIPLRVVYESKLGLINARYRGLSEAKYDFLSFIDDDNWVCTNWINTVYEVMAKHPEVGACGGKNVPVFEGEKPWWFELSGKSYAVGTQGPEAGGDITFSKGRLLGAGLTIRKSAWQMLIDKGFNSLLVGCKGKALNRGEDTELCFALVLAGWHLWYEPQLELQHFLTADRLNWRYLRKLRRGGGKATLGFDPYRFAFEILKQPCKISFWWKVWPYSHERQLQHIWLLQLLVAIKDVLAHPIALTRALLFSMEGDMDTLRVESRIGRVTELLASKATYANNISNVKDAIWIQKA